MTGSDTAVSVTLRAAERVARGVLMIVCMTISAAVALSTRMAAVAVTLAALMSVSETSDGETPLKSPARLVVKDCCAGSSKASIVDSNVKATLTTT